MSAFLGPKRGLNSRFFAQDAPSQGPADIDQFVIKRKIAPPSQPRREPPPRAGREDLIEALEELGTALRKERTMSQELRANLEKLTQDHAKQVAQLQAELQAASERERELRDKQHLLQQKEAELEKRIATAQAEKEQIQNQLSKLEQEKHEEIRKLRFEMELVKAGQHHHLAACEQMRRILAETRSHYDRLRAHAETVGAAYKGAEQKRRENEALLQTMSGKLEHAKKVMQQMHERLNAARQLCQRVSQERDQTNFQLKNLKERSMEHNRLWSSERSRVQNLNSALESERNEKHMVLACLRAAEAKIGQRDEQIAYLTKELEALRKSQPQAQEPASGPLSGPLSAEEAQKLCQKYFVAYPEE